MTAPILNCSGPIVATLGPMKVEAKQGRILLHDERDGTITHQFVPQFVHRVKALKDHYNRALDTAGGDYRFLLDDLPGEHWRKFFDDAEEVMKLAVQQIPVHDRETFHERRAKTVSVAADLGPTARKEFKGF